MESFCWYFLFRSPFVFCFICLLNTAALVVHTMSTGDWAKMYFNGELVGTISHDYLGVANQRSEQKLPIPSKIESLMVCSWSFWSEVYHKGLIDDLRVWNYTRTQDEIKRDMHKRLSGSENGLYAYYDFDDLSNVDEPRVNGNAFVTKDLGPHSFDLSFGMNLTSRISQLLPILFSTFSP